MKFFYQCPVAGCKQKNTKSVFCPDHGLAMIAVKAPEGTTVNVVERRR